MYSITLFSSILSLMISINYVLSRESRPIILITQGVIEKEGFLPIYVFWYHPNFTKGDQLVFYSLYPQKLNLGIFDIESYTGFHELPRRALEHDGDSDTYSAEILLRNGDSFSSTSWERKVQWMYDRKALLGDVPLMDLIIPGTHQSAAYAKSNTGSLNDQSLLSRWILCQRKSIKSQLMDGIRYLDLRPGFLYVEGKKKYITSHGMFDLIPMDEVVRQINEFMEISDDMVIVSFREFPKGFNSIDDHLSFMNYLEHSFERHAHPRGFWTDPITKIWTANKRLLLSYDHEIFERSSIMWVPIPQDWADVQTINRLHSYFDELNRNQKLECWNNFPLRIYKPHADMVQFTHSLTTVVQDTFQGDMSLRHWAEKLSRYIPLWYAEEWSEAASIIAVDFYETSGIVDLAIQLNERRIQSSASNCSAL